MSDHFGVSGKDEPTFIQKPGERTQDGGIVWTAAGKPKSLSETMAERDAADAVARAPWALGDMLLTQPCPNCGQLRIASCPNGKHRCGKCNWVLEDHAFAPVSL
jgi:hypothetical protein